MGDIKQVNFVLFEVNTSKRPNSERVTRKWIFKVVSNINWSSTFSHSNMNLLLTTYHIKLWFQQYNM